MKKHFSFPSINQFHSVVKNIRDNCAYHNTPLPTMKFTGTVKLHGTNAGVVKDLNSGKIWAQSRERIISVSDDNAGFAAFTASKAESFAKMFDAAERITGIHLSSQNATHIAIFGEFCGTGIMKVVAVSQLSKRFVIFGIRAITYVESTGEQILNWFTPAMINDVYKEISDKDIFNIYDFKTYSVDVDFAKPELAQAEFIRLTNEVEKECPFGKAFGVSGVGEGIVWKVDVLDQQYSKHRQELIFKTKGPKHSESKVKSLVEVDIEKVENARAFAETVVTEHRLEKMIEKMKESKIEICTKNTGEFIKIVNQDVIKEETERLVANGLIWKDAAGHVSTIARKWWMNHLNSF